MDFLKQEQEQESTLADSSEAIQIPLLAPINEITNTLYKGPLPESNKVFDGLYAGAFPGEFDTPGSNSNLIACLNWGITEFVCLQSEYKSETNPSKWHEKNLRPYHLDLEQILDNRGNHPTLLSSVPSEIQFKHFPIADLQTISDAETLQIAKEVVNDLDGGKVIYLHCWGGHGRTGVIVCLVLHIKFKLTADAALERCQTCHDKRDWLCYTPSPQTTKQRDQVRRIIGGLIDGTIAL
jgi:hypothetical protein